MITAPNSAQPLNRSWLAARINKILKGVSKLEKKHITSHSFRIGQTTSLIEMCGLPAAQQIIGHRDIRTTIRYIRTRMSESDTRAYVHKAESRKQERAARRYGKKQLT